MENVDIETLNLISPPSTFPATDIMPNQTVLLTTTGSPSTSGGLSFVGQRVTLLNLPVQVNLLDNVILGTAQRPACIITTSNLPLNQITTYTVSSNDQPTDSDSPAQNVTIVAKSNALSESGQIEKSTSPVRVEQPDVPDNRISVECRLCKDLFPNLQKLKRHMAISHCDKPFKCSICNESFNYEINLRLHIATHNTTDLRCPECGKFFRRIASLKAHLQMHEKVDSIICNICGDEFCSEALLKIHMNEHGLLKIECTDCDSSFPDAYELWKHFRKEHPQQLVKRDARPKKQILPKEKKQKPNQKVDCICSFCQKAFRKPSQLIRHERIHTGEKPFKCELCTRAFNQKNTLRTHMIMHYGYKPYNCSFCGMDFSQKGNLNAHIQRLHCTKLKKDNNSLGRRFKCYLCPTFFNQIWHYNSHLMDVHNVFPKSSKDLEKTENCYKVLEKKVNSEETNNDQSTLETLVESGSKKLGVDIISGLETPSGTTLLNFSTSDKGENFATPLLDNFGSTEGDDSKIRTDHYLPISQSSFLNSTDSCDKENIKKKVKMKEKNGDKKSNLVKPFGCYACSAVFKKNSDLERHIRIHTGYKPFKCSECGKTFSVKSNLNMHLKIHNKSKDAKQNCEFCCRSFYTQRMLEKHIKRVHMNGGRIFKCTLCPKEFGTQAERRDHFRQSHYRCPVSGEATKKVAGAHSSPSDPSNDPAETLDLMQAGREFVCPICELTFKRKIHFKDHLKTHTDEKTFMCIMCGKAFAERLALKAHLTEHDARRMCLECGRVCASMSSLRRHMETHSPGHPYSCPVCDKAYKTRPALAKHITTIHKLKKKSALIPDVSSGRSEDVVSLPTLIPMLNVSEAQFSIADDGINLNLNESTLENQHLSEPTAENLTEENLTELTEKIEQQILNFTDVHGCVFLQGTNLDLGGQTIGSNIHTILPAANDAIFRCDVCDSTFQSVIELAVHKTAHLEKEHQNVCLICQQTFENQNMLKDHLKVCNAKNTTGEDDILQNIFPVSDMIFKCSKCNQTCRSVAEYTDHIKEHEKQAFVCQLCSSLYDSESQLQNHIILDHSPAKSLFNCVLCDLAFKKESDLKAHSLLHFIKPITQLHGAERKILKKILPLPDRDSSSLWLKEMTSRKIDMSVSEMALRNSILEKQRLDNPDESESVLETSQKPIEHRHKCTFCPKSFRKPSDLIRHKRIHTGERPYKCFVCNKQFTFKSSATSHMNTHFRGRTYPCLLCHKEFSVPGSLKVHMRIHTGSKPFACHICNARFRTSGHKKSHLLSHKRKDYLKRASIKNNHLSKPSEEEADNFLLDSEELDSSLAGQMILDAGRSSQEIICKVCHVKFSSLMKLLDHMKSHHKQKAVSNESSNELSFEMKEQKLSDSNINQLDINNLETLIVNGDEILDSGVSEEKVDETMEEIAQRLIVTLDSTGNIDDRGINVIEGLLSDAPDQYVILSNSLDTSQFQAAPLPDISEQQLQSNKTLPSNSTPKKFYCTKCSKTFSKQSMLEKHLKTHKVEKQIPDENLHCSDCDKAFVSKSELELHKLVHVLEQELICPSCHQACSSEDALSTHSCPHKLSSTSVLLEPSLLDLNDLFPMLPS